MTARRTRIIANAAITRTLNVNILKGEIRTFSVDYTAPAADQGASIHDSCWETADDSITCIANASTTGYVASVSLEGCEVGSSILRNTVTFDNGNKQVNQFRIRVKNYTSLSPAA